MSGAIISNKITRLIIIFAKNKETFVFSTNPLDTFIKSFILWMPLVKKRNVIVLILSVYVMPYLLYN